MKVITPTRLLAEAAEVALAEAASVTITPTRDVDLVVPVDRAADVVSHLEAAVRIQQRLA